MSLRTKILLVAMALLVAIGLVVFFEIRLLTFLPWHIGTVLTIIWIVLLTNVLISWTTWMGCRLEQPRLC